MDQKQTGKISEVFLLREEDGHVDPAFDQALEAVLGLDLPRENLAMKRAHRAEGEDDPVMRAWITMSAVRALGQEHRNKPGLGQDLAKAILPPLDMGQLGTVDPRAASELQGLSRGTGGGIGSGARMLARDPRDHVLQGRGVKVPPEHRGARYVVMGTQGRVLAYDPDESSWESIGDVAVQPKGPHQGPAPAGREREPDGSPQRLARPRGRPAGSGGWAATVDKEKFRQVWTSARSTTAAAVQMGLRPEQAHVAYTLAKQMGLLGVRKRGRPIGSTGPNRKTPDAPFSRRKHDDDEPEDMSAHADEDPTDDDFALDMSADAFSDEGHHEPKKPEPRRHEPVPKASAWKPADDYVSIGGLDDDEGPLKKR